MAQTRAPRNLVLPTAFQYLNNAAKGSAEYSERHFRFLGALTIVVPLAYIVDVYVGKPYFDTFAIRTAAFVAAIPLLFSFTKQTRTAHAFHLYFVGVVAYVLPFTFGLMLILNAASAAPGEEVEIIWILQYFISLFLFIQLIHNGPLATLLWTVSTFAALGSLLFLNSINWNELNRVMIYPVTGYLTALFFGIITNRNVDYVNSEKLRAASAIGGNIAHELRTPLASIRSLARSVRKHSETMANAYMKAKDSGLDVGSLSDAQVDGLRSALSSIEQEVEYSNTIIDMLLLNTSNPDSYNRGAESMYISGIVREAIARYPFNNSNEKNLINVNVTNDFMVHAPKLLLVHVFFNLLKNSIYYAQKSPNGTVFIQIGNSRTRHEIEVTDTGPGIQGASRRRIFDRFFTAADTGQGAGIGLSFCKMVMESIGGEIQCESREGEYTTFRLIFPAVSDRETSHLGN